MNVSINHNEERKSSVDVKQINLGASLCADDGSESLVMLNAVMPAQPFSDSTMISLSFKKLEKLFFGAFLFFSSAPFSAFSNFSKS